MIIKFIIYILAGLAAGAVTGLTGLAAAVVITPALTVLCGMDGYQAVTVALACSAVTSAAAAYNCGRQGHIQLKKTPLLLITAAVFAIGGCWLGQKIPHESLGVICVYLMPLMGLKLLFMPQTNLQAMRSLQPTKAILLETVLIGAVIGLLAGFIGVGSSELLVTTLTIVLCYDIRHSTGTGLLLMAVLSLAGCVGHICLGGWPDTTALVMCVFAGFIGTAFSAKPATRLTTGEINRTAGYSLLIVGIILLVLNYI